MVITASRQQETQWASHKGTRKCFGLLVSSPAVLAQRRATRPPQAGQLRQEEWHWCWTKGTSLLEVQLS